MMVGLSVVLETKSNSTKLTQVINKATNISLMPNRNPPPLPSPSPPSSSSSSSSPRCSPRIKGNHFPLPVFLEQCFLCGQKLLPGTDIYMYKGDSAFCSEECRYKQIFMDEDDQNKGNNNNCSLMAATRPNPSFTSRASSYSSGSSRHNKKGASRNPVGGFAY